MNSFERQTSRFRATPTEDWTPIPGLWLFPTNVCRESRLGWQPATLPRISRTTKGREKSK
jgi:hypothetical protein